MKLKTWINLFGLGLFTFIIYCNQPLSHEEKVIGGGFLCYFIVQTMKSNYVDD